MSRVRQPRCTVTVNGKPLTGVIEAEVTNASHFTADTFHVVAAVKKLPSEFGPAYWALSINDQIAISASLERGATQLILGQIDNAAYDPIQGTLTLTGRDLSALLIDSKSAEKFQNKRSSEIAEILALRHGLDSSVQQTSALAGDFYEIDNVLLTQEQTEWDLLIYLAQREGFDVWVSGTTLFFQPPPALTAPPYPIRLHQSASGVAANVTHLRLERSETLARDVVVKVQTWNQKQQRSFTVTYRVTQAFKSQRAGGKSQLYSYVVPNLNRDQALAYAKNRAEEITRNERILTALLPGDNLLNTRTLVQLSGTATAWDQTYFPDTVTRRISLDEGYRMELRAKNHSTQSTVVLG